MSSSHARRWLLLADFCAVILAVVASESSRFKLERPALLVSAGVYLVVTGIILFFLSRRSAPPAEPPAGASVLGRRGPAFLAYVPRLVLGAGLLAYAFRP